MTVESKIGSRPDVVNEGIDAPDLWSSILTFSSATQLQGSKFHFFTKSNTPVGGYSNLTG